MERGGEQPAGQSTPAIAERKDPAWQLRKYLLLLAILVAAVTYVTGLDPPGGVWLETNDEHLTGNPILPDTRRIRYALFYYFNATAFAASLVVIVLLLSLRGMAMLLAVRWIMGLDLLCLMVAYIAGSCRDVPTTVYASLLSTAVFAYVVAHTLLPPLKPHDAEREHLGNGGNLRLKERRKVLMLLAIFVTTITYTAGLSPPGGFWEHAKEGQDGRRAGDPVMQEGHPRRFVAFLVCNTTAFDTSLAIIMLLLSSRLRENIMRLSALYACIAAALLGLMGAYAAGSSRATHSTVYVLCLVGAVILYISIVRMVVALLDCCQEATRASESMAPSGEAGTHPLDKARSLILLLATLAATVTYQAGLHPPGGVWRDKKDGHNGGDLILLATHAWRYKVFFYCNSAAFVASIIVIMMVPRRSQLNRHALEAALILDLFGLMGAYAAGSCRDVRSSSYVFALASVIFVFMVIHVVVQKYSKKLLSPPTNGSDDSPTARNRERDLEKRRKLLLLFAILAVTITYHAGLTPPGGFWIEPTDKAHSYGDPVLADNYPRRYKVFFYCNATSFMASVAVIILLVNRNLSDMAKEYYIYRALYVCMAAGLFGLIGAYGAGTSRRVQTSIYVFTLVGVVLVFAVLHINVVHTKLVDWFPCLGRLTTPDEPAVHSGDTRHEHIRYIEEYRMRKYLMLLGILAASVTYEAGLTPPGGVWPDSGEGHAAGHPILRDSDRPRFRAFFYSNSTSFVASIVVIVLLLQGILLPGLRSPLWAMRTAVVLDLLGLLVAYAAGSSRDWGTSGYVLAMGVAALAYLAIYVVLWLRGEEAGGGGRSSSQQPSPQGRERPTDQLAGVPTDVVEVPVIPPA